MNSSAGWFNRARWRPTTSTPSCGAWPRKFSSRQGEPLRYKEPTSSAPTLQPLVSERNRRSRWTKRSRRRKTLLPTAWKLHGCHSRKKNPEEEGVHYSDLFEQFLPVRRQASPPAGRLAPRILLQDTHGTWRPPPTTRTKPADSPLRQSGTLRRIKRFANALIDGVPVRDKDRPRQRPGPAGLAAAMSPCRSLRTRPGHLREGRLESCQPDRRAADRSRGRLSHLRRRGGEQEAKPKKRQRKMIQDDDE